MPTFKVLNSTWAKQSPEQNHLLDDRYKLALRAGEQVEYVAWKPSVKEHVSVELPQPRNGYRNWLVYDPDVQFPDEDKEIWLDPPYYTQRDNNSSEWWRQCNSSTHAMLLNFLKPGAVSGDDQYIERFVTEVGDTTDWAVHTCALEHYGIRSEFRQDLSIADLERSLRAGYPVAIGVAHKGSVQAPFGGHVLLICGMKPGAFLANDPWGRPFDYLNHNGKKVEIPIEPSLNRRWLIDGDSNGWGRLIKSVDGKRTGL